MRTVVGLFDRFEEAQRAVEALNAAGFDRNQISLVAHDREGEYSRYLEGAQGEDLSSGAATGAGIGAVLGGLGGLLVGLGALAIPGIGPVLAAGPLISTLAGAGIGAAAGGIVGVLVDMGIPEEHANAYAEGVRRGGTLVTVRTDDHRADEAVSIMNRFSPVDIDRRISDWRESDEHWTGFDATRESENVSSAHTDRIPVTGKGDVDIPVIEEDIEVGKREVERGGVEVRAYVEEEPYEEDVTLREETIHVERRPVNREATEDDRFVEGSMELREVEEEPVISKQSRVVEEVHIEKDVDMVTEKIRETLRHQRVDVDRMDMEDFRRYEPTFRQHYQTQYTNYGRDYDYYDPAYRYGYSLGSDQRFHNYDWERLEPGIREDWERGGYSGSWDDVRDAVRYGWESTRRR
jgi:uncharacterized protein (TIGR02271 family)